MAATPFETTLHKTNTWISEVAARLELDDRHAAYRALRAVLQALRDRLTVDEACQLAAQLPLLLRGVWFEGYRPSGKPVADRSLAGFLDAIRTHHGPGPLDPETAASAVFAVLERHVSAGEVADVQNMLPRAVRALWPQSGPAVLVLTEEPGGAAPAEAPAAAPAPESDQEVSATEGAIGAPVKDHVGERLGEVHDLVIDPASGQVRFAVLAFGGFLGLGQHLFPVPWTMLRWREGDRSFQLLLHEANRTIADLEHAPRVAAGRWRPARLERALAQKVNDYYRAHIA